MIYRAKKILFTFAHILIRNVGWSLKEIYLICKENILIIRSRCMLGECEVYLTSKFKTFKL